MKSKLIGFMGAPGTGKTTLACAMKEYVMGKNASSDVCTEYAREFCFQFGIPSHPYAQYRLGMQQKNRENRLLNGNCEFIFSDSPLWLIYIYSLVNSQQDHNEEIQTILADTYEQFVINNMNRYNKVFLLKNDNPMDDGCRNMDVNTHISDIINGFASSHKHVLPIIEVNIPITHFEERKQFIWDQIKKDTK